MKNQVIKNWYCNEFKNDEMGKDIKANLTFKDVYEALENHIGGGIYDFIGAFDSLVRERIFRKLTEVYDTDYITIREMWYAK